MIKELDRVALTQSIPEQRLEAGDVGTVVMVHKEGEGFTLEFVSLTGETVAIATVRADAVRELRRREITHVREVA